MINHVLFDLDGTLVDTAVDLANALNVVRQHKGLEVLPLDVIKPTVSLGGNAMINLAFGLKEYDEGFEEIRDAFLRHYSENIAIHSRLFDGMETVLNHIEDKNIPWGIVTNKSKWLTNPLVTELELDKRTKCIVSGDTTEYRKPHPAPLHYACQLLNADEAETIYIGDAERDIEAGKRAGMHTLIALYGYIDADSEPNSWQADGTVNSPEEIIDVLTRHNQG